MRTRPLSLAGVNHDEVTGPIPLAVADLGSREIAASVDSARHDRGAAEQEKQPRVATARAAPRRPAASVPSAARPNRSTARVVPTGIEPVASSVSRKRSPTELIAPTLR